VLSLKMTDPQFSGQTKERLSSRQAAASSKAPRTMRSRCG
jgi:DNA gyrase/topoisomerase IV subunit B